MSAYDRLPRLKTSRETAWYDSIPRDEEDGDESLNEGLRLLESLRGTLPPHKARAIDEAKKLLTEAARLYARAKDASGQLQDGGDAVLDDLLPPHKKEMLTRLCALIRGNGP